MRIKRLFWALLLALPLLAAADDDCDFDQAERLRNILEVQKQYPGSRYLKDQYALLIPRGPDEVTLSIGGCVHYGVGIELKTKRTSKFNSEAALMKAVLELIKNYSQGLVEYDRVVNIIAHKDWRDLLPTHDYYVLNYDEISTFEVYRKNDNGFTIIGLNFYQ
jgi:hypothetical protein